MLCSLGDPGDHGLVLMSDQSGLMQEHEILGSPNLVASQRIVFPRLVVRVFFTCRGIGVLVRC